MTKTLKNLFSGTAVLAVMGALSLSVAEARPGGHVMKADANGDGQITQAEFLDQARTNFAEADANGDGQLTPEERKEHRKAAWQDASEARFLDMDANGDGAVTVEEFRAAQDARSERFEEMRENWDGEKRGMRREGRRGERRMHRRGDGERGNRLERFDVNEDGFLSYAEHEQMAQAMFDWMDANEDGVLNKDDRSERRERRRQ